MTIRQICDVKNHQLTIHLPDGFKDNKKVLVIVDDGVDTRSEKLSLLKQAAQDPIFLSDIKEVMEDFGNIDFETL